MKLELMPFQVEGANLLAQSRRAMLAWDAGVGKTPTAVMASVKAGASRVLVFCPPIAVGVWRQHFKDWGNLPNVQIFDAKTAEKPYAFMAGDGVRIVPYSRLVRSQGNILEAARRTPFEVVILDECHYLKNSRAIRTKAVYGAKLDLQGTVLQKASHVWCLSGTPLLNHAAEFWTHLHALRPDLIVLPQMGQGPMDEAIFIDRFCITRNTPYGVRIYGSKNTHELAQRIKPFVNRKRLTEVLPEMPELRIVEHPLPADTVIEKGLRAELVRAMSDLDDRLAELDPVSDDELLAAIQAGGVAFSTIRRLIGRAKVEGVAALAHDFLEDNPEAKLIVFAHHREVIKDLAGALRPYSPLVITGETGSAARENAINVFQSDRGFRLIILAIEAAGESITLHAANNVIVAEPSPVPAKNHQAIARAHRNGQKNAVLARFVLLPGTLDARLMSIVARKTRDIARIVDNALAPVKERVDFPDTL